MAVYQVTRTDGSVRTYTVHSEEAEKWFLTAFNIDPLSITVQRVEPIAHYAPYTKPTSDGVRTMATEESNNLFEIVDKP